MSKARDIMRPGAVCVNEGQTLLDAARMMAENSVGSLPICGSDDRIRGILTDRDIVVRCVAEGGDPESMTAGQLATDDVAWVSVDADQSEVVDTMTNHRIRRLPVIDDKRLVGMISEADLARGLDDGLLSRYVQEVYSAPPNN